MLTGEAATTERRHDIDLKHTPDSLFPISLETLDIDSPPSLRPIEECTRRVSGRFPWSVELMPEYIPPEKETGLDHSSPGRAPGRDKNARVAGIRQSFSSMGMSRKFVVVVKRVSI